MKHLLIIMLIIINITLIHCFEFLGDIHTASNNKSSISVGDYTYMIDGGKLTVWDYSDPLHTELVTIIRAAVWSLDNLYVTDDILWLTENNNIYAYDISSPESPQVIFNFELESQITEICEIELYNNYLILSLFSSEDGYFIRFYDFEELPNMVQLHEQFENSTSSLVHENDLYYIKVLQEELGFNEIRKININNINDQETECSIQANEFTSSYRYTVKVNSDYLYLMDLESVNAYLIQDDGFVLVDSLSTPRLTSKGAKSSLEDNIIYTSYGYLIKITDPSNLSISSIPSEYIGNKSFFKHDNYLYYGDDNGINCFLATSTDIPTFQYYEPKTNNIGQPIIKDNILYVNTKTGYYSYLLGGISNHEPLGYVVYDQENYPLSLDTLPTTFIDGGNVIIAYIDNNSISDWEAQYDLAFFDKDSFPELNLIGYFPNVEPMTDLLFDDEKVYGICNKTTDLANFTHSFIVFDTSNGIVEMIGETNITQNSNVYYWDLIKSEDYISFISSPIIPGTSEYSLNKYHISENNTLEFDANLYSFQECYLPLTYVKNNYMLFTETASWGSDNLLKILDMADPTSPILYDFELDFILTSMMIEDGILYTSQQLPNGLQMTIAYSFADPSNLVEIYRTNDQNIHFGHPVVFENNLISFYSYIISMYRFPNITSSDESEIATINKFSLNNFPNPFNPETTISFNNPESGKVTLSIYNIKGQLINTLLDEETKAGVHNIVWNGKDEKGKRVASGIYFSRINTRNSSLTKKMILMK